MPRKKTVQPEPLERFHLPDGTEVDIVDETCWPIGRGQHFARDFQSQIVEPILKKIVDDYLSPNGAKKVDAYLSSATTFAHQVASWGFLGEEGRDDSNVRKKWYMRIKIHFDALINAKNEAHKGDTA